MVREILETDIQDLLHLYTQLHDNPFPEVNADFLALWEQIRKDKNHHIIVAIENNKIVSSCVLMVIPNLTHNQRPYGLIENVITHKEYRKKGLATACLNHAREIAKQENCYKLMLLTGSKMESTLRFYEQAGYNRNDKTAFIQWL
jgi:GNAT superfamily N-acetyltransferase